MGNKTLLMYGGLFVLPRSTDKFDNTPLIEAIDRLCHICNHRHIKLESQARIEFVLPRLNADKAGKLIGIELEAYQTVDLFRYQTGGEIVQAHAVQGPIHPILGIAMDMSIQLKSSTGAICTLSLSFNNDGPLGTVFRYIGDTATWIARYDDLFTGKEEKIDVSGVDVSMNGIELQDREFFAAIRDGREPNSSVAGVLPCYRVLHQLEQQLGAQA